MNIQNSDAVKQVIKMLRDDPEYRQTWMLTMKGFIVEAIGECVNESASFSNAAERAANRWLDLFTHQPLKEQILEWLREYCFVVPNEEDTIPKEYTVEQYFIQLRDPTEPGLVPAQRDYRLTFHRDDKISIQPYISTKVKAANPHPSRPFHRPCFAGKINTLEEFQTIFKGVTYSYIQDIDFKRSEEVKREKTTSAPKDQPLAEGSFKSLIKEDPPFAENGSDEDYDDGLYD